MSCLRYVCRYVGLLPGDPTVESLPCELPADSADSAATGLTVIDE